MKRAHSREGDTALLMYNLVKGSELEDQSDPSSRPTGNTTYVLTEVCETQAGVDDILRSYIRRGSRQPVDAETPAVRYGGRCVSVA